MILLYLSSSGTHATGQIRGNLWGWNRQPGPPTQPEHREKLLGPISHFWDPRVWWLCAPKPLLSRGPPGNTAPLPSPHSYCSFLLPCRAKERQRGTSRTWYTWLNILMALTTATLQCAWHNISCSPRTDISPWLGAWRRGFLATKKQTPTQQLRNRHVYLWVTYKGSVPNGCGNHLAFLDLALGKATGTKMPRAEIRSQNALVT